MPFSSKWVLLVVTILLVFSSILFVSCKAAPASPTSDRQATTEIPTKVIDTLTPLVPTETLSPPKVLRVCMNNEPGSLFLYGDVSQSANDIRQAIYDGPFDVYEYELLPVILNDIPDLEGGGAYLQPVEVSPGSLIVDHFGNLVTLSDGVVYRPSGCKTSSCAIQYSGTDPVLMDQLVVQFQLLSGLKWSDGEKLTADDSIYSFQLAKDLYPGFQPDLIDRTHSYQALGDYTVVWRGLPGFMDPTYQTNFFTPLPRHAWGDMSVDQLLTSEQSARMPIGWGPFVIEEWLAGEKIILQRNPEYFRSNEGLPYFDRLEFLFYSSIDQVIQEIQDGQCNYLGGSLSSALLLEQSSHLLEEEITVLSDPGSAWEHIDFGIDSFSDSQTELFTLREVRQAITYCIDREKIVEEVFSNSMSVLDNYIPPANPSYSSDIAQYSYDPEIGKELLHNVGWIDHDENPDTPRKAQGVPGVQDGTEFTFQFLSLFSEQNEQISEIIQKSLRECGVQMEVVLGPTTEIYAPGPDGVLFGRNFSTAQYAWSTSLEPPCFLYVTGEIPGPYPEFPKGWGGANASGFSNPEFDDACLITKTTIPDWEEHQIAVDLTQTIYTDQLPSIPLFLHSRSLVTSKDLCGILFDASVLSPLWDVELYDIGENCSN